MVYSCHLHPEHAESGVGDGGVEAGGEREGQHAPRVCGGDDAVVPQPRRGVIRIAFVFVFLADRRLEGFGLLGRLAGAGFTRPLASAWRTSSSPAVNVSPAATGRPATTTATTAVYRCSLMASWAR